jgi:glycosyltransferase involved in cell wall biosynthesis
MRNNVKVSISTVTPVYRGEDYLVELVEKISLLRDQWRNEDAPVEIVESIFVDDGSVDNSYEILEKLSKRYSWVRVITLSRNYGQHSATVAGVCYTHTDWVVTLDEDLQHDPAVINTLLKFAVAQNLDVVYAKPIKASVHGNTWRDHSSRIVKSFLSRITGTPQIKAFNSFRLIRGSVARAAASSSSSQTYFDMAISWFTKSYDVLNINMRDERFQENNKSGYGLIKLIRHARHLIVSSQVDVASVGLLIGGIAIIIGIFYGALIVSQRLFFPSMFASSGWPSLMATIIFFSGVITAILCIALEYIHVILINQLGKPTFFAVDRSSDIILKKWVKGR